ncbi:MAG: hypothetical protein KAH22_06025 [Thiotrichaceae bacterium]|nr:hypothetical protein [Thiotrichaceae bacterium]
MMTQSELSKLTSHMNISRRLLLFVLFISMLVFAIFVARNAMTFRLGGFYIAEIKKEGDNSPEFKRYPVSGLNYSTGLRRGTTSAKGVFKYREGKEVFFKIDNLELGISTGGPEITQHSFRGNKSKNMATLLFALDEDGYRENGIQVTANSVPKSGLDIDLSLPEKEFKKQLTSQLTQHGTFEVTLPDGKTVQVSGLNFVSGIEMGETSDKGHFSYQINKKVTFKVNQSSIETIRGTLNISPKSFSDHVAYNFHQYLLSIDEDKNSKNGIELGKTSRSLKIDFSQPKEAFEAELTKQLIRHGRKTIKAFTPSLGINIEAPQAEADTVGQAMPFVDIFRTARPFKEFSDKDVEYDKHGWPTKIPEGKKAYTLILQSLPRGAVPYGRYTVLYDGVGTLAYDGLAKRVGFSANKDIIDIRPENSTVNRLILRITDTSKSDPLRNIRIIMPGGICEGTPHLRVEQSSECAYGHYRSFVTMLKDRNRIVFNPDYLRLLTNFKVLRMMNFMEASQHIPKSCYKFKDDDFNQCVKQPLRWSQRAKMSDSVWGGSHRTDATLKQGVPVEVLIALANKVNAEPWFTIPHNANDEYVEEFSKIVYKKLNKNLKAWIEYSNETWNGRFWAAHYVRNKGRELALDKDKNPFREGFRFYSKRSVEIFKIWEKAFDDSDDRLIRIMGSYQNSTDLSKNILAYEDAHRWVDALAIAPYFHACANRAHRDCKNILAVPTLLSNVKTVDQVFEVLRNKHDPYAAPATYKLIKKQASLAKEYDVSLVAYEGGQHLAVNWSEKSKTQAENNKLNEIFSKANKDPRMGELYGELLTTWKNSGGTLFNMFNMPQTWHRWGSWGIKSHLNQPREEAIKYDACMLFQEKQGKCWWDDCDIKEK